MLVRKQYFNP